MTPTARADARNAALCAAVLLVAVVVTWPVSELAFNDDWSYAFTAKRLLETGRLMYNGWSSPTVITQSYWALAWVKVLGFSMTTLRLSTVPLGMGAVAVTYLLGRRAGLAAAAAALAALTVALSPLFLPLATSFMSDVPCCLTMLASAYLLVRAAESPGRRAALGWIGAGLAVAAVGGASRQVAWVIPLALLPYVAWLRRHDLPAVAAALAGWVATIVAASALQRWFNAQPFSVPEDSVARELLGAARHPGPVASRFAYLVLTLILLALPVGVSVLPWAWRSRRHAIATGVALAAAGLFLLVRPSYALAIWMPNMLTRWGIFNIGDHAVVLVGPVRVALGLTVFAIVAVGAAAAGAAVGAEPRRALTRFGTFFLRPAGGRATLPALLLVTAAYLVLEITRCQLGTVFDRHLAALLPFVAIALLALGVRGVDGTARPVPRLAWVVLAVFGVFAVAATQEVFARGRAQVAAADRLRATGVPRTQIDAGFEYNFWTELEQVGYINMPSIWNPPDAFREWVGQIPHVHPIYRVEYRPTDRTVTTPFGTVGYFSLLPPFHRRFYIDRYADPRQPFIVTPGPRVPPPR